MSDGAGKGIGVARALAGIVIVVIAVGALGIGLLREARVGGAEGPAGAEPERPGGVTVYYFHGDKRCETCLTIEARTVEAVRSNFGEALESGRLRMEVVNFDVPEHRHYRQDFDLSFGSVVVQEPGGEWENLADVWTLVHEDPGSFERYLVEHIEPHVGAAG